MNLGRRIINAVEQKAVRCDGEQHLLGDQFDSVAGNAVIGAGDVDAVAAVNGDTEFRFAYRPMGDDLYFNRGGSRSKTCLLPYRHH